MKHSNLVINDASAAWPVINDVIVSARAFHQVRRRKAIVHAPNLAAFRQRAGIRFFEFPVSIVCSCQHVLPFFHYSIVRRDGRCRQPAKQQAASMLFDKNNKNSCWFNKNLTIFFVVKYGWFVKYGMAPLLGSSRFACKSNKKSCCICSIWV